MALQIVLTTAGIAEIVNAVNTGTDPVTIDAIGLGDGQYTPTASQTALVSEIKQLTTIAGEVVADDTIHVTIKDESTDAYDVGEFGLFTDSGTLLGVYSQPSGSGWILQKAVGSTLLLSVDIKLDSIDAASLTFGDVLFSNPPATETVVGVIEIADATETQAGTDDDRAMTPLKDLQAWEDHLAGFDRTTNRHKKYTGDLNAILVNSLFNINSAETTNSPAGFSGWGFVHTMMHSEHNQFGTQVLYSMNLAPGSERIYFRQRRSSAWDPWIEIFHGNRLATQTEAEAGTENSKLMTPLRVVESLAVYGLGSGFATNAAAADLNWPGEGSRILECIPSTTATPSASTGIGVCISMLRDPYSGGPTNGVQFFIENNGTGAYFRAVNSGSWTQWVSIYSTGNMDLVGSVAAFGRSAAPTGWLKCNGAAVSRTTYSNLFAAIGTTFGVGNGSTTFNLPDLRGEFVRGWDDGRGVDSGRALGSYQADDFKSHTHTIDIQLDRSPTTAGNQIFGDESYYGDTVKATNATGGTETRPRNRALLYCIKY